MKSIKRFCDGIRNCVVDYIYSDNNVQDFYYLMEIGKYLDSIEETAHTLISAEDYDKLTNQLERVLIREAEKNEKIKELELKIYNLEQEMQI